jgi:hypothetical protein
MAKVDARNSFTTIREIQKAYADRTALELGAILHL